MNDDEQLLSDNERLMRVRAVALLEPLGQAKVDERELRLIIAA